MLKQYAKYLEVLEKYGITDPDYIRIDGSFEKSETLEKNGSFISYSGSILDDGVIYMENRKNISVVNQELACEISNTVYVRNIDNLDFQYKTFKTSKYELNNQIKNVILCLQKGLNAEYLMEELQISDLKIINKEEVNRNVK